MTPPSPGPLFLASRSRGPLLRLGCRARLRRPSDLKHHAAPDCGNELFSFEKCAACPVGELRAWGDGNAEALEHHAACGEWGECCALNIAPPSLLLLKHYTAPDCAGSYRALRKRSPASWGALGVGIVCPSAQGRKLRSRWWLFEELPPETKLSKNARGASAARQKLAL